MRFPLPAFLLTPGTSFGRYVLKATVAVLVPSFLVLGCMLVAQAAGWQAPDQPGNDGSLPFTLFKYALLTPIGETFILVWLVGILSIRLVNHIGISGISAVLWGVLHGLFAWPSFFTATAAFFIFTMAFLTWRPKSFWHGYLGALIPHLLTNLIFLTLATFG